MAKIYDNNGWVNWVYLWQITRFITAVTGPRGVGKTYGLLKFIAENDLRFIYMRRLKSQLDQCTSADGNPFKSVNTDTGSNIMPRTRSGGLQFIRPSEDDTPDKVVGYGVALSTVATIRGVDYSDVDVIVFDEYIAMSNERPIKDEANAFYNFIETVNRNRELLGREPVKVFMLGNANKLMNPYFLKWHFMKTALRMIRGGQMMYRTPDGMRNMVMLLNSPVSELKKETALYQTADDDFISMAIDNAFATDATQIETHKLTDCRHIVSIGDIGIYQLKSNGKHYISETRSKSNYYEENEINIKFFRARFIGLKTIYLYGFMTFENYDCEMLFRSYIGI